MRQRLTNPKTLGIALETLKTIAVEDISYRFFTKEYIHTDNGSCQCYKDCNCSSKAGTITKTTITWYRNTKFDGTDKCFYSEPYTREE